MIVTGATEAHRACHEPEWWLFSAPICELLVWVPRVGDVRRNRILRRADVWPLREVGKLTLRQRQRILAELQKPGVM